MTSYTLEERPRLGIWVVLRKLQGFDEEAMFTGTKEDCEEWIERYDIDRWVALARFNLGKWSKERYADYLRTTATKDELAAGGLSILLDVLDAKMCPECGLPVGQHKMDCTHFRRKRN